jgi:hypothetical protein
MATANSAPPPPPGYAPAYPCIYPKSRLNLVAVVLGLVLLLVLSLLTWLLHGRPSSDSFTFSGLQAILILSILCLVPIGTVIVHEYVHGLAYRLFGYRVTYGIVWPFGAYAGAFHQYQTRQHALIVALAPLCVITLLFVPLLALPNPVVIVIAFLVFLLNTSGSVADVYWAWRLARILPTALQYDTDAHHIYIYEPTGVV